MGFEMNAYLIDGIAARRYFNTSEDQTDQVFGICVAVARDQKSNGGEIGYLEAVARRIVSIYRDVAAVDLDGAGKHRLAISVSGSPTCLCPVVGGRGFFNGNESRSRLGVVKVVGNVIAIRDVVRIATDQCCGQSRVGVAPVRAIARACCTGANVVVSGHRDAGTGEQYGRCNQYFADSTQQKDLLECPCMSAWRWNSKTKWPGCAAALVCDAQVLWW